MLMNAPQAMHFHQRRLGEDDQFIEGEGMPITGITRSSNTWHSACEI